MQKLGVVKKFIAIFGIIACLGLAFMSYNVVTSCEAQAQCSCGTQCTYIGAPTAALFQVFGTPITSGIIFATGWLTGYWVFAMEVGFALSVGEKIWEVSQNQIAWWDTFWYYNLRPAMMDMTDQLSTMDKHQDLQLAKFADVQNMNRTALSAMKQDLASHRELRPGENVCQAGSVAGGMGRAAAFSRAYEAAVSGAKATETGNAVGTPGAQGNAQRQRAVWADYVAEYCDPTENAGASGCAAAGPNAGRDIDVAGEVFEKDTIDLKDPDTNKIVNDLLRNIAEPRVRNPLPAGAANNGGAVGQEQFLKGESYKAKRNAVHGALHFVVARRAPGTAMKEFLDPMRTAAGVDAAYLSPNPSRNEVMQVMMSERFGTGTYSVDQVDNPQNNAREMVIQQAFQAIHWQDQLDLLDRFSLLLAAELSESVRGAKSLQPKAEEKPTGGP